MKNATKKEVEYKPLWKLRKGTKFKFYGEEKIYTAGTTRPHHREIHIEGDDSTYCYNKKCTVEVVK